MVEMARFQWDGDEWVVAMPYLGASPAVYVVRQQLAAPGTGRGTEPSPGPGRGPRTVTWGLVAVRPHVVDFPWGPHIQSPRPDDGLHLLAHWIRIGVAHSDERVFPSLSGLTPETMLRKTVACPESPVDPVPGDLLHAAIAWCAVHVDLLDLDRLAWLARRRVAGGFARALLGAVCDAVVRLEPTAADALARVRAQCVPLSGFAPVCRHALSTEPSAEIPTASGGAGSGERVPGGDPTFRRWGLYHPAVIDRRAWIRPRAWVLGHVPELARRVERRQVAAGGASRPIESIPGQPRSGQSAPRQPPSGQSLPGGRDPSERSFATACCETAPCRAERIRVPASFVGMALEEAMVQALEDWG